MMTAEQLKCSIYQQIFSGKLTQQLREDGSTKALIDSIEKTVPKTSKIARIEKQEDGFYYEVLGNKKVLISDELPFDIPDNWEWVHLNKVAVSGLGKTLNKSKDTGETKQYLCSINVYWDGIHLEEVKKAKFSDTDIVKYKLQKGDLLICEGGDAGRTAIWNNDTEMYYQNALHRVRFYEGIDPYYFCTLMEFYKLNGTIDSYCKGMTIKHLVQGSLNAMYFPLPPLAEQKRIVAKIEELMPFVEQYAAASTKLNTLNTTFPDMMKKSILQEAVQGKLVPQDPSDEPASVLLKKIAEEKKRLIKEGKIKKDKNTSRIAREGNSWFEFADGQKTCIDDEIPFEIPDNWSWVRLNELGDYKKGPFGSALTKSMFVPAGPNSIKVYEQKNAIQKDWTLGEYYIRKEYYEEKMYGFTVEGGDVIVSCAGTIGETYVMPDDIELGIINQALMRMKIYEPINVNYFLMYFDYVIKGAAREQSKGSAIKNIPPFAIFKRILFPMPPLSEQDRILSRLTEILLEVDKLG